MKLTKINWLNRLARTFCGAGFVVGILANPILLRAATTWNVGDYGTLTNAVASAANGDTINITNTIAANNQVVISNVGLTILGNGNTIAVPVPGVDPYGVAASDASTNGVFWFDATGLSNNVQNLIVEGGSLSGADRVGGYGGGIVLNNGTLALQGVTVTRSGSTNAAVGGGLWVNSGCTIFLRNCNISTNFSERGGGFFNAGIMFIEDSTVSGNQGDWGGSANSGALYANNSTFANNVSYAWGGALYNTGTNYCVDCTFVGNAAGLDGYEYDGGAIANDLNASGVSGKVTLVNSLFAYNYSYNNTNNSAYTGTLNIYLLDDLGTNNYLDDSVALPVAYNCVFQSDTNRLDSASVGTTLYTGNSSGSDNSLFSGGSLELPENGAFSGSATIWQANLGDVGSSQTPTATLLTNSFALGKGARAAFSSVPTIPVVGYCSNTTWIPLSGSSPSFFEVTTDQNGVSRGSNLAVGAVTSTASVSTPPSGGSNGPLALSSLPTSITLAEDGSTNLNFAVSDNTAPIYTVITTASSSNSILLSTSDLWISGSGTNRVLSIRPALHVSGSTKITVIASDDRPASVSNSFTLTVISNNYPPMFLTAVSDTTRLENARPTNWSFTISDLEGPASHLTVTATSTNTSLVANSNLVVSGTGASRKLTLTQTTNQNGTTLIQLVVADPSGTSATNDFVLTVWPVNQPPTFTLSTNRLVYAENYHTNSLVTVSNYVTNVTSGPTNQSAESNWFVFNYVTNFFAQAPSVATNGSLTFQVATNSYGTNIITVVLVSSGSTTNGGKNTLTNKVTLDVPLVNHVPSFTINTNALTTNLLVINEESTVVTNVGFLTNLSTGTPFQSSMKWAFTLTPAKNSPTNAIFTKLLAATNGTLTVGPKAHSYGTNTVTVVMSDVGENAGGGVFTCTNTFEIGVAQTNHAPVIVGATNRTVLENGTHGLAASLDVWSYDLTTNFTITATSSSNTLVTVALTTNASPGFTSNVLYTLTFNLVSNANGIAPIVVVASEGVLSATNTFNLDILAVNQAPTFTMNTNAVTNSLLLINEESPVVTNIGFLTGLSAGAANESKQTWKFTFTAASGSSTNAVFTTLAAATNGTLTVQPKAHSYGTNIVTMVMTDSGGTANGGVDASTNTFEIGVARTNHVPVIVGATNRTVLENGTSGLTASINVWSYDQTTNFSLTATSSSNSLVSRVSVTNSAAGTSNVTYTLTFTLVTNVNGTGPIVLVATEGSLSATNTFNLDILAVNQPPSFTLAVTNITVNKYDVPIVVSRAVTGISVGPANQSNQKVTFDFTNSSPSSFLVPPAIDTNGTLTFTPAAKSGNVTVGVMAGNNGGTANGGVTNSPIQNLTIIIPTNEFQNLAGPFAGLFYDTNNSANASSGYFSLVLSNSGSFKGYLLCAGGSNAFNGQFGISNSSASLNVSNYALNLTVDTTTNWTQTVSGFVSNTAAGWSSTLLSYLAGYSATNSTPVAGGYLMVLPYDGVTAGPAGDSIFSLIVSNAGAVSLTGNLADDTSVTQVSQISSNAYYPLYIPLYGSDKGAKGALIGWVSIVSGSSNNVSTNTALTWFNEAGAGTLYTAGFTNQAALEASAYSSSASPLLSFTNGSVILAGGDLTVALTNTVTITNNLVTVEPSATNRLSLTITSSSGEIVGSFVDPTDHTNYIEGVVLQNTNFCSGYFYGTNQAGTTIQVGSFILQGN